jgi:hypothetical protein
VLTRMGNNAASISPQRNCFLETIRYGSVNERVNEKHANPAELQISALT